MIVGAVVLNAVLGPLTVLGWVVLVVLVFFTGVILFTLGSLVLAVWALMQDDDWREPVDRVEP